MLTPVPGAAERVLTRYRRDIDGLRAIAVGMVVLFHAGFGGASGGFVGVDVFFVISGYLITANLHGDLLQGRFSIAAFYERRARRILPALFAMMLGAALGAALFLPNDLKLFAESAAATALSVSNVFFWRHTGYFDAGASVSPLLHTWSLAVEEQFYLVFPLLLWATARAWRGRKPGLVATFALLWALSFGFSLWQVAHDQRAAFYLPLDRVWELLTGALLAMGTTPASSQRWVREVAAAAGLALVLVTAGFMPSTAPFPGFNALAPCLGAGLMIWAGARESDPPTLVARALQFQPLVFLGLISYSLYLWHWPLLVFARYYSLSEPGPQVRIVVLGLSVLAAAASWRWVERPFRTRARLAGRPAVFAASAAAICAACVCGGVVVLANGLPQRLPPKAVTLAAGAEDHNAYRDRCFAVSARDLDQNRFCRIGVQEPGPPTLAVWGDSHADALMSAFDTLAKAKRVSGVDITHGSCPPLLDVEVHEHEDNLCPPLNAAALALIERYNIRTVVLAARWAGYAEGRLSIDGAPPVLLRAAGAAASNASVAADKTVFAAGVQRTFARLRGEGRTVYVVLPVPEVGRPVAETLARAVVLDRTLDLAPSRQAYDVRQRFVRATLDRLARSYGVIEIDPASTLCGPKRCRIIQDGHPLYYDADHLSTHGATLVQPLLTGVFARSAPALQIVAAAVTPAVTRLVR